MLETAAAQCPYLTPLRLQDEYDAREREWGREEEHVRRRGGPPRADQGEEPHIMAMPNGLAPQQHQSQAHPAYRAALEPTDAQTHTGNDNGTFSDTYGSANTTTRANTTARTRAGNEPNRVTLPTM